MHVFALFGVLIGVLFRVVAPSWRSASPGITGATLAVSVMGAIVAAVIVSALTPTGEFLDLSPFTATASVGGALAAVGLLGTPPPRPEREESMLSPVVVD
ncbi:MAG: hypothetical protein ACT4TC_23380 [Myxococcaceae bacterium]